MCNIGVNSKPVCHKPGSLPTPHDPGCNSLIFRIAHLPERRLLSLCPTLSTYRIYWRGRKVLSIISLFIVVFLSILVTRIASIALTHTGMTRESARFQARSAFTGAGFTTAESEMVVNHPVRRKIVQVLMLLGNAGIIVAASSLILTFVTRGAPTGLTIKIVLLIAGMIGLWSLASSKWADRMLSRYISRILNLYTKLAVRDYNSLLHLAGEYRLAELEVQEADWINGKSLAEAKLREEGINVLGIKRQNAAYIGNPLGETLVKENDSLILYGRVSAI